MKKSFVFLILFSGIVMEAFSATETLRVNVSHITNCYHNKLYRDGRPLSENKPLEVVTNLNDSSQSKVTTVNYICYYRKNKIAKVRLDKMEAFFKPTKNFSIFSHIFSIFINRHLGSASENDFFVARDFTDEHISCSDDQGICHPLGLPHTISTGVASEYNLESTALYKYNDEQRYMNSIAKINFVEGQP